MRWVLPMIALLALPSTAAAEVHDDYTRIGGYFALGVGGDATGAYNSIDYSASLDPTLGFGLRLERGLGQYVSVGGNFELMTFEADVLDSERETIFDIDLYLRVRYLIEVSRELWIEPYVGVPIGLSLGVLGNIDGMGDEIWPGWNVGALAGAYLVTSAFLGFFLEVGWRFHQVFTQGEVLGFDIDARLETHQFAAQLGVSVLFD